MPDTAPTTAARTASRTSTLDRNLGALALRAPRLARRLAETEPTTEIEFVESAEEGVLSAVYRGSALASRRRPRTEAQRLASTVEMGSVGAVAALGFGLGHHVDALARRAKGAAVIVVFEPDLPLLRAVLERVDCAGMLGAGNVMICTAPDDHGALTEAIHGAETLVAMGVRFVEHPPSVRRLGDGAGVFTRTVTDVVASVRSQVITTMVQSEMALRNALMNAPHYAAGRGVADLAGAATGHAAIVVAAGPSLRRNMALLRDPAVRERCVIIAAQTTFKPLLAEGIRPHFVTALDYHEISARFYEGLTAADVEGVTLVVEPKANPAILASYPGVIRCVGDESLDAILEPLRLAGHGRIKPGATVAHMSYYLARHLGCEPVILVGQDLGFTDGQYYSDGASIHRVWACELNPFRTLEMMEWERIVRGRSILRKATDHLGRPIYTDEQMGAYLTQFEHDFLSDSANDLRIIDATEGGVRKAHTTPMALSDAIAAHVTGAGSLPPALENPGATGDASATRGPVRERLLALRRDVVRLAGVTRRASELLEDVQERLEEPKKANPLIERVHKLSAEAQSIRPAFDLVQRINQTGAFNRIRADRALRVEEGLDPREEQRRRLERDRTNLRWFADAADSFTEMLAETAEALEAGEVRTRIPSAEPALMPGKGAARGAKTKNRCVALIDGAFGSPEMLDRTVERLGACEALDGIEVIPADHPARASRAGERRGAIMSARRFAPGAWRGALGGLTCYDEVFDPTTLARAMEEHSADAALLVGADWALVDPGLCDGVIRRHRESPAEQRLTFTQAPPGLAGACIARSLVEEIRDAPPGAGAFASIGGLLGYLPMRPTPDRIAKPVCVGVAPGVRDLVGRWIADTPLRAAEVRRVIGTLGGDWPRVGPDRLVAALGDTAAFIEDSFPAHTVLRGCTRSAADWLLRAEVTRPDAALTLEAASLDSIAEAVAGARGAGFAAVHVRTGLDEDAAAVGSLLGAAPDVISVDVLATTAEVYESLTGSGAFDRVMANVERLLAGRRDAGGIPAPWVVPRITRRDAVYEQIEAFYDYWLCRAGAAVIDPAPATAPAGGDRIAPLTVPEVAAGHAARTTSVIDLREGA